MSLYTTLKPISIYSKLDLTNLSYVKWYSALPSFYYVTYWTTNAN